MANWTYDPSMYQERSFEIIPQGDHRVRITDVVEKRFNSGNEGYEMTLEVNDHSGHLWFYLVLNKNEEQKTHQRIGDFFDCFGIQNYAMGSGKQWIGSVGAVRVKHEEYNGRQTAKVAYLIARKNQDKLAPWKGNSSAAIPAVQTAAVEIPSELPFE